MVPAIRPLSITTSIPFIPDQWAVGADPAHAGGDSLTAGQERSEAKRQSGGVANESSEQQPVSDHQDNVSPESVSSIGLLGLPLMITDYSGLGEACKAWTHSETPVAVDYANTQVVVMRRHEPQFRHYTEAFDYFSPDGMPLVWCLNRAGAGLRDRVYGPTFMREFLNTVPGNYTHYLLGGSDECGRRLKERFLKANPITVLLY